MELKEKTITNDIDVNEVIHENNSINNTQTQMSTSFVTNTCTTLESLSSNHSKERISIDDNIDIEAAKNRSLLPKENIFSRSLDELTTVGNLTESYKDCYFLRTPEKSDKNCKDAGDAVHRSTSLSQSLFIDLCSPEKYVENNSHTELGPSNILKNTKKSLTETDVDTQMIISRNDTKKIPQKKNSKTFNVRSEELISNCEAPSEKTMTDNNLDQLTSSNLFSYEEQGIPLQNNESDKKSDNNCKDAGDAVHRSTSSSQSLFIDLCSPEKYVENNSHTELGPSNILKDTEKGLTETDVDTQMIISRNDTKKIPQKKNLKSFNVRSEELISNCEAPSEKTMTDNNFDQLTSSNLFSYEEQCIPLQNNESDKKSDKNCKDAGDAVHRSTSSSQSLFIDLCSPEKYVENNSHTELGPSNILKETETGLKEMDVDTQMILSKNDTKKIPQNKNLKTFNVRSEELISNCEAPSEKTMTDNNLDQLTSSNLFLYEEQCIPLENNELDVTIEGNESSKNTSKNLSQDENKIIDIGAFHEDNSTEEISQVDILSALIYNGKNSMKGDIVETTTDSESNNEALPSSLEPLLIESELLEINTEEKNSDKETKMSRNLLEMKKSAHENSNILRTEMMNSTSAYSSFNVEMQNNDNITSLSALASPENEDKIINLEKQEGCDNISRYGSSSFFVQNADILSNHQTIIATIASPQLKNSDNVDEVSETDIIRSDSTSTINFQDDSLGNLLIDENPHITSPDNEANLENNGNERVKNFVEAEFQASSELLLTKNYSGNTDDEKFNKKDNESFSSKDEEAIIRIVEDSTHMKIIEDKDSVVDVFHYTEVEPASSDTSYSENKILPTKEVENLENINEISCSVDSKHKADEKLIIEVEKLTITPTDKNRKSETSFSNITEKSVSITESNEVTNRNEVSQEQSGTFDGTWFTHEGNEHSEKHISSTNYLTEEKHPNFVEDNRPQEKIPFDDECTSSILGEKEIQQNSEEKLVISPLPAMTKSRCADSHNVVGNLGKVMLLMSQTEPRRLKRNISFTSPIKINDPSTMFDNVPNNSSVECDTQKPQFNIDILASVASKQKPLRVDIKQDDEYSTVTPSDNPKNKQSLLSILKEEGKSTHDKIKQLPCDPQLINMVSDTSFHTSDAQSNSLSMKNKCKKNKLISKSHKSGRKKNSYATSSTASKKVTDINNKNVKQKRHENSQKEELKHNKKSVTRNSSLSKDKKIKVIKSKEKSPKLKYGASEEYIPENFDSDDSLPLSIRMKKIESSPGEYTSIKISKKDPPSRNSSRKRISKNKGYSKNKLSIFQKKNAAKKRDVECKNEIGTKTSIISDKIDKNITISPVKEDRSRRIVHFKKAMLELISQDLDENVSNISNTNVPETNLNSLISNDNQRDSNSSSIISHCEGIVNNKISSASSSMNNIEPELWNTASETIVEYKVISSNQDNLSANLNCSTMNPSNSSPIVESHLNSGNNSGNLEKNFMNTYKKTDKAVDISSTHSGKNIQCVAETSDSISNFIPSTVKSELIKTKIITNENLKEKGCLKSNIGMADSSFLPKHSEKESTEFDNHIKFDKPNNIKAIEPENQLDFKIQFVSPNTENDLMESSSPKSQEKVKSRKNSKNKRINVGFDEPLLVETEQSCQQKVNKFKENDSHKSCDLKVSLLLPANPLSKIKNSELTFEGDKLHTSSSSELNSKDTPSLSKNRRKTINKSISQENSTKAEYTKSTIGHVEVKSLKYSSPLKENAQDKILEPPQDIEEKQNAKQKRIPKEDKSVTSSPNIIVEENHHHQNHKIFKKKTKTLYDTKQELSSDNSSLKIKKISVNEKGKTYKKLLINKKKGNDSDVLGSGMNIIKCQEADSQKVKNENTPKSCILKISTSAEKYDAKCVEKSGRSKRKRSQSETSPEDTDGVVTNRKKSMSNERNLCESSKTILSGKKSCSNMLQEKLNIGTELVEQEIGESIILKTVTEKILAHSPGTRNNKDPSEVIDNISILPEKIPFVKKNVTRPKQKTSKKLFEGNICKDNLARETGIILSETNSEYSDQNEGNKLFESVEPYSQLDEDWNVGQKSVVIEMKITEGNEGNKCEEDNHECGNESSHFSCEGNTKIFNVIKDSSDFSVQVNVDQKSTADGIETSKIIHNSCEKLENVIIELSKSDGSVEKNQMSKVKNQTQKYGSGKNAHSNFFKTEENYPSTTINQEKTINADLSTDIEIELQKSKVASPSYKKDELMSSYESSLKVNDYEDLAVEGIIETEMQSSEPVFSGEKSIITPSNVKLSLIADDHSEHVSLEFVSTNYKKDESIDSEIPIQTDDLENVNQESSANNIIETQIQVTEQVSLRDINDKLTKNSEIPVCEVAFPSDNRDESTGYSEIIVDAHLEGAVIEDSTDKPVGDSDDLSKSDEKLEDVINEKSDGNIIETEIQESEVVPRSDGYTKLDESEPLLEADVQLVDDSENDSTLESKIENQIHVLGLVHSNDENDKATGDCEVQPESDVHSESVNLKDFSVSNHIKAENQVSEAVCHCNIKDKTKYTEILPKSVDCSKNELKNENENLSEAVFSWDEKDKSRNDSEMLHKSDDDVKDVIIKDFSIDNNIEDEIQVSKAVALCNKRDETKHTEILPKSVDCSKGEINKDFTVNNINENENQSEAVCSWDEKDKSRSDSEMLQKSDDEVKDVIIKDFSIGNNIEDETQVSEAVSLCNKKDKTKYTEKLPKSVDCSRGEINKDFIVNNINENENQSEAVCSWDEKDKSRSDSEMLQKSDDIQVSEAVSSCDKEDKSIKDIEILPKSDHPLEGINTEDFLAGSINENEILYEVVSLSGKKDESTSDFEIIQKPEDHLEEDMEDFSVGINNEAEIQVHESISLCEEKDGSTKDIEILPKSDNQLEDAINDDFCVDKINVREIESEAVSPSDEKDKSTSDSEILKNSDNPSGDVIIEDFRFSNNIGAKIEISEAVSISDEKEELTSDSEVLQNSNDHSKDVIIEDFPVANNIESKIQVSEAVSLCDEKDKSISDSEVLQNSDHSKDVTIENFHVSSNNEVKIQVSEAVSLCEEIDKSTIDSEVIENSDDHSKDVTIEDFPVANNIESKIQVSEAVSLCDEKDKSISNSEVLQNSDHSKDVTIENFHVSSNNEVKIQVSEAVSLCEEIDKSTSDSEVLENSDDHSKDVTIEDYPVANNIESKIQVSEAVSLCDEKDKSISDSEVLQNSDHSKDVTIKNFHVSSNIEVEIQVSEAVSLCEEIDKSTIDSEVIENSDDHSKDVTIEDFSVANNIESKIQVSEAVSLCDEKDKSISDSEVLQNSNHSKDVTIENFHVSSNNEVKIQVSEAVVLCEEIDKSIIDSEVLKNSDDHSKDVTIEDFPVANNIESKIQVSEAVSLCDEKDKSISDSEVVQNSDHSKDVTIKNFHVSSNIKVEIQVSEAVSLCEEIDKSTIDSEVIENSDDHSQDVTIEDFPVANNIESKIQVSEAVSLGDEKDKSISDSEVLQNSNHSKDVTIENFHVSSNSEVKIQVSEAVSLCEEIDKPTSDSEVLDNSDDHSKNVTIEDFHVGSNIESKIQVSEAVSLCDEKDNLTKDAEILPKSDHQLEGVIIEEFPVDNIKENESQSEAVSPSDKKDNSTSDYEVIQKLDDNVKDVITEDFSLGNNIEAEIKVSGTVSLCDEKDKRTKDIETLSHSDDHLENAIIEDFPVDNINGNEIESEVVSSTCEKDNSTSDYEVVQKSDNHSGVKDFSLGNITETEIQVSEAIPSSEKDKSSASEFLPKPDGNSEDVNHEDFGINRTIETIQISEAILLKNQKHKLASDSEVLPKPDENSEDIIRQNFDVGNIIQKVQISESDQKDISISDSEMLPKLDNHLKNVINENVAVGNEKDKLPRETELTSTPDGCPYISKSTYLKQPIIQNIVGIEYGANEKYYFNAKKDMLVDTKWGRCSLVDESKNLPLKELTADTSSQQKLGNVRISIPKKSLLMDQTSEIMKLPNNKRKHFEGQEETDTFIVSKKCNTEIILNKEEKLSENETSLKIFHQSGEKLPLNESEPEENEQYVLQVPPNVLQETVEHSKNDASNPIKYQETIPVTECPLPLDTINLRTEGMLVLNEERLISSENISNSCKLSTSKNLEISIDSKAENNMQPSEIDIPEIKSSKTKSSCHSTEKININTDNFQENHTSTEITKKCLEYVEVTKEPEHALNLSLHKSEMCSTEGKTSVEEQYLFSSICQETPEVHCLNPPKNELSFSIEKMLQPCSKNQQKKNCDNLQNMTKIETSKQLNSIIVSEEQANKGSVCTNVISDTFKHPNLLNYNNLGIKKTKSTSLGEIEEMKQINEKEKPNSKFKMEENRKVIVERVYSMDELAVGTPISPCLNICSAPILPISTEFIPYRYGIYNTVIPTAEKTIVNDSCFHSRNEGTSNKNTINLDARIKTKTVYEEKDTKKETSILEKEIKSIVEKKKIADTKILKSKYKTLVETTVPCKSENDIEIIQVEGQNDTASEIQKFGHSVKIQKPKNKTENLDRVTINVDKPILSNQNNKNSHAGDVQHTPSPSLSFISTQNKPDQVGQFDTFMKKTNDKKKLSSENIDNANIFDDHCSNDIFKSEINHKTKKSRKCSKSILSCSKSKELVGKSKHHSSDQGLHLDKFNGLNTNLKKSTNILNESLSLKPLNEMNPISQSVKLNEDSGNKIFIENINQQQNISVKSSTSSTFNMEQVGADSKTVGPRKHLNDSSLESNRIETIRANYPPTQVSSLLNSNMEHPELSDSFVNKVVVQSSDSEGMESFLTSFQSAITIAQSLQGSFSLFSDNSDNIQFAQQNQVQNEEILHADFQEKAVLPINQPEVFLNNRLNLPQSTPIRSQGTSQADESIFNMSDDIFDFDFNNVNQTASGSTYSNSFVNGTMSSENLQMIFDNPEFLHLLYNLNDVGCEVTVDNTNVEDMAAKPAEYIASELIQEQLEIPPFIAEEEFDSNAPTDPMVGGQKELVPDPKQDSTLDEVPFPESALSFDEEMMHRYALFLHCDVNSTGQSSAADQLNQTKNLEEPAENSIVQSGSKQNSEYALIDQKTSNYVDKITPVREKSLANSSKVDIKNNHSATSPTQETANITLRAQETIRSLRNSSLSTLSPNSSSECNKSSNKTIGKKPVKVQKIPASKYAPPKKQRNQNAHQTKKPKEKAESKLSKTSLNEKGKNLTSDLEFNNSLDMPELFSPNETSYKSKSLPSIHNRSKTDSKTRKLEGQSIKKSEKLPEDDSSLQMQYNMYDRTKAMKRNAAMRENYCEFFDDVSSSSNKNKKRKISIKVEPGNHTNFPNVKEEISEKQNSLNEYESQTKKIKIEDTVKHETCETKNVASMPLGVQHPHVVRDLNAEFDKLKNSGPYKSTGSKNIKYTRTDRILRSAQEACSSHYQASTSSHHNYADCGNREDREKRENTECYRKSEDLRRKPKAPEWSRSQYPRSSAYTSTSSDYRRETSRRSKPLETKRNDAWHGREPYIPSDERRRMFEGHNSRDVHRKVDRNNKPSSSRTSMSQSQQKSDSKNGEEWFKKLDELWPLERNVYQSTGH
ncbi:uncharacterized protein LOC123671963 isoform X2 [Harmonia axyridis]|nr:uncharacterized protein LOC123671963 isoform X2 [Harmonia axyridis]